MEATVNLTEKIDPDPWIRFDMWAERAWEQSMLALAAQQKASEQDTLETQVCALATSHDMAASTALSIAQAAANAMRADHPNG